MPPPRVEADLAMRGLAQAFPHHNAQVKLGDEAAAQRASEGGRSEDPAREGSTVRERGAGDRRAGSENNSRTLTGVGEHESEADQGAGPGRTGPWHRWGYLWDHSGVG